jgi:hypothetical protein
VTRAARQRIRALSAGALIALGIIASSGRALAEPTRSARFVSVNYRDVVDPEIEQKLRRGLPSTIVLTGTLYQVGKKEPVATTAQTCKITWHVWDEVYVVEITRPGGTQTTPVINLEGVLKKCAEAHVLLTGTSSQVSVGSSVYLSAKVQVNPVSEETLEKIKRWVTRPSGTATAAPGDALFSTFTGLFVQRIGDADRELKFTTKSVVPAIQKPPPPKAKK